MTPRRCAEAGCDTILSRYNDDDYCRLCQAIELGRIREREAEEAWRAAEKQRAAEALRQARAAEEKQRRERERGLPRPGSLTRLVWDAMPGTLAEIAEKTGLSTDQVRWTIPNMRRTGWVETDGRPGCRQTGPLMVYSRATRREEAA